MSRSVESDFEAAEVFSAVVSLSGALGECVAKKVVVAVFVNWTPSSLQALKTKIIASRIGVDVAARGCPHRSGFCSR